MNISFLHKPLGCLLFILLLFVLASTIISCAVDVVQVNVIKRFSPGYKTWAKTAKEEKEKTEKEREEKKKIEGEKRKNIEDSITKKLNIKSVYNFGHEPEILFFDDKEIYAIVPLEEHGETALIKTEDGGKNWETILAGTENRYIGNLSIKQINGKKTITVFLDFNGDTKIQSENGGKKWKYFNKWNKKIILPIKNGKIAVY